MEANLDDLGRLSELQTRLRKSVAEASSSLCWFAKQLEIRERIPLNMWRGLDRPLPRDLQTLGLAFEVWHAMLRSERTLRLCHSSEAKELRTGAHDLLEKLKELIEFDRSSSPSDYARKLASDEIFGTFNALSAASVLRAEVFPERFDSTPSYLAGQILVAELRVAHSEATAHNLSGIRERAPRLVIIAQAVHSLMLYVEHLRKRSSMFKRVSGEIERLVQLQKVVDTVSEPHHVDRALNGYAKLAATRLAALCGDGELLLIATRRFFKEWRRRLEVIAMQPTVDLAHVKSALDEAVEDYHRSEYKEEQKRQETAFEQSHEFCDTLSDQIEGVHAALEEVLTLASEDYEQLYQRLQTLNKALDRLEDTHRADTARGEYPSIRDAARFQFPHMLIQQLSASRDGKSHLIEPTDLESDATLQEQVQKNIKGLRATYRLEADASDSVQTQACAAIRALGSSPMGRNVLGWWRNYADCYQFPLGSPDATWMSLRHESFKSIKRLTHSLEGLKDARDAYDAFKHLRKALDVAANEEASVAGRIELLVKRLTQWCAPRGKQLLLESRSGLAHGADPLELAAALWLADRLGEPWDEKLEQEAFDTISALQRSDGSFGVVAPLFQNRGFMFYLPSASIVALLARFVTRGTAPPKNSLLRRRLQRWEPVLMKSAEFLVDTMVPRQQQTSGRPDDEAWAGWHSDRHPEADRIDCLATVEAATALCRVDDALKWLINLKALGGFRVSWPESAWERAVPTDCEAGNDQLLLKIARSISELRRSSESYATALQPEIGQRVSHAFAFYGPPGTGKSYCQSVIAGELGWPLLMVVPSDFLRDGEDRVVHRASDIFDRLSYLSNVCIVFDEFDEMIATRNENRPPWVTAAMLPLMSDLREQARRQCCTLSLTTNYIEDVDQAAIRVGRIDDEIPIMYPDFSSRLLLALLAHGTQELSWQQLRKWCLETALCTQPHVATYMEAAVMGGDPRPPRRAVGATYYADDLDDMQPRVKDTLRELFASVGEPGVVDEWLVEDPEWTRVYKVVRRVSPRTLVNHRIQISGTDATIVEVSNDARGFRLRVVDGRELPEHFVISSENLCQPARRIWPRPEDADQTEVGAITVSAVQREWRDLINRLTATTMVRPR